MHEIEGMHDGRWLETMVNVNVCRMFSLDAGNWMTLRRMGIYFQPQPILEPDKAQILMRIQKKNFHFQTCMPDISVKH